MQDHQRRRFGGNVHHVSLSSRGSSVTLLSNELAHPFGVDDNNIKITVRVPGRMDAPCITLSVGTVCKDSQPEGIRVPFLALVCLGLSLTVETGWDLHLSTDVNSPSPLVARDGTRAAAGWHAHPNLDKTHREQSEHTYTLGETVHTNTQRSTLGVS
jgi:hypothetical protein